MKTIKSISIRGLIMGFLATQGASIAGAIVLMAFSFFVYGSSGFAAMVEYFIPIMLTLLLGVAINFLGGYVSIQFDQRNMITPIILGALNLALSLWFFSLLDFKYGGDYAWIMNFSLLLIIPTSCWGARYFLNKQVK